MEISAAKKTRVFRGEEAILNILADYKKSKLSIKAFCLEHNIASATFHNWKKKYSRRLVKPAKPIGFAELQVTSPTTSEAPLFAANFVIAQSYSNTGLPFLSFFYCKGTSGRLCLLGKQSADQFQNVMPQFAHLWVCK